MGRIPELVNPTKKNIDRITKEFTSTVGVIKNSGSCGTPLSTSHNKVSQLPINIVWIF